VLFITWDEDSGRNDDRVLALVLRPDVKHRVSAVRYDHYSLLATNVDILGVPRLANAATATPMRDLIGWAGKRRRAGRRPGPSLGVVGLRVS